MTTINRRHPYMEFIRATSQTGRRPASAAALSAEIFVIPLGDKRHLVYAPLRQAAFIANNAMVGFIADLKAGKWDRRKDPSGSLVEFLRRLEIVDAGEESPPTVVFTGDPKPVSVTLFLTNLCNLRCTYCYASAGEGPSKTMTLEVARRGIDFVAQNAQEEGLPHFEVAYHGGGEPTLAWRTMTESLAYAKAKGRELGMQVHAFSATNGVLTDRRLDWIIANLDGVSLSFDGLPSVHDAHRLNAQGDGTSEQVMRTMRRFDAADFHYGLRMTVTSDTVSSLADSVEFICTHCRPQQVQVEPAYKLGRWENAPSAETEAFVEAFREAQQRARKLGREIRYSAARLETLTNHFCAVSRDSFCLSPDGNVSACFEVFSEDHEFADRFFYGNPDNHGTGYTFELPILDGLRAQGVQNREHCQGCYAKWHCAGDCYHKALTTSGTNELEGSGRCHITRELTKDQILDKIEASGGLFWHELPASVDRAQFASTDPSADGVKFEKVQVPLPS